MKYKKGQELYYVNPFVFTIDKIKIDSIHDDFYNDSEGGIFMERDLFLCLDKAKRYAKYLLNKFYGKKLIAISKTIT